MKLLSLIFILSVLLFGVGCNTGDNIVKPSYAIEGKWELRNLSGSIAGFDSSFAPGNGRILVFLGNNYEQYAGGALIHSGNYQITRDTSYLTNTVEAMIAFDGTPTQTVLKVAHDTLFLRQEAADGIYAVYKRMP
jgi:hypothetical protein